jgi:hypothetical protein
MTAAQANCLPISDSRRALERAASMTEEQPVVFIVDDDALVRDSLKDLFRSVGLEVQTFY